MAILNESKFFFILLTLRNRINISLNFSFLQHRDHNTTDKKTKSLQESVKF